MQCVSEYFVLNRSARDIEA
jgi:hypothetical protein